MEGNPASMLDPLARRLRTSPGEYTGICPHILFFFKFFSEKRRTRGEVEKGTSFDID